MYRAKFTRKALRERSTVYLCARLFADISLALDGPQFISRQHNCRVSRSYYFFAQRNHIARMKSTSVCENPM